MKSGDFMPLIDNYLIDNYLIDGSTGGIKFATGTARSGSGTDSFQRENGGAVGLASINVTTPFRPHRIIVRAANSQSLGDSQIAMGLYNKDSRGAEPAAGTSSYNLATYPTFPTGSHMNIRMIELIDAFTNGGYVNNSGFRFAVPNGNTDYIWEAYGF